jgi:hypothetical protein
MNSNQTDFNLVYPINFLPVVLDGVVLGYVDPKIASHMVKSLRSIKIRQDTTHDLYKSVPMTLEIAYLPPGMNSGPNASTADESASERNYYFPGIFMSSQVSRFIRPV